MLNLRLIAYDCVDHIEWSVQLWDHVELEKDPGHDVYRLTGSMKGRGEADPTRWLRELLEEVREHM